MRNKISKGFTKIELIIDLAIVGIVVSIYARAMNPSWAVDLNKAFEPYAVFFQVPLFILFAASFYNKMKNIKSKIEAFAYLFVCCGFIIAIPVVVIKRFSG